MECQQDGLDRQRLYEEGKKGHTSHYTLYLHASSLTVHVF